MMSTISRVSFLGAAFCVTLSMAGCAASDDPNDDLSTAEENWSAPGAGGPDWGRPRGDASRSIVIVGINPESVDLSDPAFPPDLTHEKIRAGLEAAQAELIAAGHRADFCFIQPDATAEATVQNCFDTHPPYDAVVIGAGIRTPPNHLFLFENVLNTIHRHRGARFAGIAFNTRVGTTTEAAERALAKAR
jgi:hypothetical protein